MYSTLLYCNSVWGYCKSVTLNLLIVLHKKIVRNLAGVGCKKKDLCKIPLRSDILPCDWLHSIVVPIFKKYHRYEFLNYRPVSLTPVPCKEMEKLF